MMPDETGAPPAANAPPSTEARSAGQPSAEAETDFLVVGIGASAGGLEVLGELLPRLPLEHMAYIVIQHLAPNYESALTELLARGSKLEVVTAAEGMALEEGHLYVIPPNVDLGVLHGVIQLITRSSAAAGPHMPIDFLFRSLAEDQGANALGVVLSGTGTDGTFGLKAIKAAGGLTFVQAPSTAKYDGMPRSAVASGSADFCLAPQQIASELTRIANRPRVRYARVGPASELRFEDQLGKLFMLIRSEFGNDLTNYKPPTIERRIERRMALHKLDRFDDYLRYVQENRDELEALYKDMLITVTRFFRDPEVFEALKTTVLARLFDDKNPHKTIRVWVPACASGEEAYSIAMCLLELVDDKGRDTRIQIFGTDIDDDSIQLARRGIYPANIEADVPIERLNRFFVNAEGKYQISRRVRDVVVFSRQNVLKDAPFSRMDLVSCRNVLIYLQPASQKKVLRILHYALQPSGHLLLGSSETVGDSSDLYSLVDRANKIYSKKDVAAHPGLDTSFGVPSPEPPAPLVAARPTSSLQGLADRKVLEWYGPPGVVINEQLEILQFRGHTGPYLDPMPGVVSFNLLRVARFELHVELRRLVQEALAQQTRATAEVTVPKDGKSQRVKLDVMPLHDAEARTRAVLVLFQDVASPAEVPVVAGPPSADATPLERRNQHLERELAMTKEYLQTTVEEKESSNEELRSANEELQSSNEELQSTNEELETSREELQSTNEELVTVNEELQNRMAQLSQANDDLHNVLAGVDNAVVIIGMDLRIRRYTTSAERLFNLVPTDVGRTIGFLDSFLGTGGLDAKASTVINSLSTLDEEIVAANHHWYTMKIQPYKTLEHSIRGALITLTDIDVRKRSADTSREVASYANKFLAAIGHPLLIVDRKLRIVWANDALRESFELSNNETVGALLPTLGAQQWADPGLRERLDTVFGTASTFRSYPLRFELEGHKTRSFKLGASQVPASVETPMVLLSLEPIEGDRSGGP